MAERDPHSLPIERDPHSRPIERDPHSLPIERDPHSVALVLIGEELLRGYVVDTNAAYLGQRLSADGFSVVWAVHARDDIDNITLALRQAASVAPTVIVSGGLGPTSDDVTREALAVAAGTGLVRDSHAAEQVQKWFERRGRRVPPDALRMADLPEGGRLLTNARGSAPGVRVDLTGALGPSVIYAVPGVPTEMRAMVDVDVLPDLLARFPNRPATAVRALRVAVLGESWVAHLLRDVEADVLADEGAEIAYLASPGEVVVRISVSRPTDEQAQADLDTYLGRARVVLGDTVAAGDPDSVASALLAMLRDRGHTLAVAESLTGGLLAGVLSDVPGASSVLLGGAIAYTPATKRSLLGVTADVIDVYGVVSPQCAEAMALGALTRTGATVAVSTTGVAGPDEHDGHPVGTVFVSVALRGRPNTVRTRPLDVRGERSAIRQQCIAHALDLLRRTVLELPEPVEPQ